MATKVGTKGQVVIEKSIRDRLGVKPGWLTVQLLVDDHVQIHFVPPEHDGSLAGMLKKYAKTEHLSEVALQEARDAAWLKHIEQRWNNSQHGDE